MKDSSRAPEQNDWKEFRPLFGGGKIKICDTLRAVTPLGGLSVFIEFLSRIELVEQLTNRGPYQPESPNHYEPGQILVGFILSVIVGAQRFAHANQLRADRALHALLGMRRFPSDDTILNYFRRFSQAEIERFLATVVALAHWATSLAGKRLQSGFRLNDFFSAWHPAARRRQRLSPSPTGKAKPSSVVGAFGGS